jgi:hypothetical protein
MHDESSINSSCKGKEVYSSYIFPLFRGSIFGLTSFEKSLMSPIVYHLKLWSWEWHDICEAEVGTVSTRRSTVYCY